MTLSDLASLSTVVSGVAVLASLVYVAQQMRQNTKHTRAMIEQTRNSRIIDAELLYVSDPAVRGLAIRGDAADPSLSDEQVRAYFHFVSAQLMLFEDLFYQHREGLIGAERHASTVSALRNTRATHAGFRAAWTVCRRGLGREFQNFVEGILADTQPSPEQDMTVVWRRLAAAQRLPGTGEAGAPIAADGPPIGDTRA